MQPQLLSSLLAALLSCAAVANELINSSEYKLFRDLFHGYNPLVRPRHDIANPVQVRVTYYVAGIHEVNEKQQTITLSGWLKLEWQDEFLAWNQHLYENQSLVVVPPSSIWIPDIIFDNGVGQRFFDSQHYLARLYFDGSINWEPGGPMTLSCQFDLTTYPFDAQKCIIKIVTWANTGSRVETFSGGLDFTFYEENGEWNVILTEARNHTFVNDGENYSEVHFFIHMKRKPLFHVLYMVCPIVLLSVLNSLVFLLPTESGEKVSLSLSVLLAFSVFLLMMIEIMPSSADKIPHLGVYITTFMVMSSISVITTVFVINMHQKHDSEPVPPRLQRACSFVLRLKTHRQQQNGPDYHITWKDVGRLIDRLAFISFVVFISGFGFVVVAKTNMLF